MASAITHAVVASAIGAALPIPKQTKRIWLLGALCAILPDADVVGFWMGVPYDHVFGHRGITHSVLFAVILSGLVLIGFFQGDEWKAVRFRLWAFFFLATISHGIIDAFTDGGLGIAFWAPFQNDRYFSPWRPVLVSPLTISGFFTTHGWDIMKSEMFWIWIPVIGGAGLLYGIRKFIHGSDTWKDNI